MPRGRKLVWVLVAVAIVVALANAAASSQRLRAESHARRLRSLGPAAPHQDVRRCDHANWLFACILEADPRVAARVVPDLLDEVARYQPVAPAYLDGPRFRRVTAIRAAASLVDRGLLAPEAERRVLDEALAPVRLELSLAGHHIDKPDWMEGAACKVDLLGLQDCPFPVTVVAGSGGILIDGAAAGTFWGPRGIVTEGLVLPGAVNPEYRTLYFGCTEETCPATLARNLNAGRAAFELTVAAAGAGGRTLGTRRLRSGDVPVPPAERSFVPLPR